MAHSYVKSFLDPFDQTITSPKILDGAVPRSSGLRFRNAGNFALDSTGLPTYVVLLPGFSNSLAWKRNADALFSAPPAYTSHFNSSTNRQDIQGIRVVSSATQFSLMNTADQNDGYWEAVRIPISALNLRVRDVATDARVVPVSTFAIANMAEYSSYQTGKLRDIHRFQFKINSTNGIHSFKNSPSVLNENVIASETNNTDLYDPMFDMVVIKMYGRTDAIASQIMYNSVSNQEVTYEEGTALARLDSYSPLVRDMDLILDRTKYVSPGVQIS